MPSRRDTLKLLAAGSLAAAGTATGVSCASPDAEQAHQHGQAAAAASGPYERQFFTDHEWDTLHVLVDMIIPADERSGSATDAGVPEFIDYMMMDPLAEDLEPRQTAMRGGLAWLDRQCVKRFEQPFLACSEAQRAEMLDAIAWPDDAEPGMEPGVAFFNTVRDFTATGFWTSRIGVEDLQYMGNVALARWDGCSHEACQKLGVSYEALDAKYEWA